MAKNVEVKLLGDNRDLNSKLEGAGSKLGAFAKKAGKVGGLAVIAAGAGIAKLGLSLDSALDNIIVGTGATGDALAGLKTDFESVASNVPSSFGDVSTAIADVNTRLGLTGKPLQDISTQFLDLSRLTGTDVATNISNMTRVFGDAGVAAEDQGLALDKLFTASQASGISLDALSTTLVNFGAPMRQLGFSLDESTALLAKFDKEGVNTEAVLAGMKAGLGKMAKAGEDPIETFDRVTESIKNAGSQGEANAIALEAFGQRAGPDMAAAIREGRFEIDDMLGVLGDAEGSIADTADATESWTEKLKILANKAMIKLAPLAEKAFGAIEDGVAAATPFIEDMFGFLQKHVPPILRTVSSGLKTAGNAISTAFDWIVNNKDLVIGAFTGVAVLITTLVAPAFIAWAVNAAAAAIATALLYAPIVLAIAAFAAIGAGLVYAYQNFEGFRNVVDTVVSFLTDTVWPAIQSFASFIGDVFSATVGFVAKHWDSIMAVIDGAWTFISTIVTAAIGVVQGIIQTVTGIISGDWGKAWDGIQKILSNAWLYVRTIVTTGIDLVKSVLAKAWPVIKRVLAAAWDAMKKKVGDTIDSVIEFVSGLPERAKSALSTILTTLVEKGLDLIQGLWNGATTKAEEVMGWVGDVPGRIRDALGDAFNFLKTTGVKFITGLKNGLIEKFNDARAWVGDMPGKIRDAIGNAGSILKTVGRNIITGLKNGMINKWNDVMNWIRDRISSLGSVARTILGIRSPSKVFAKIGSQVGEGMVVGLDSMTDKVQSAADKLMPSPMDVSTSANFSSRVSPARGLDAAVAVGGSGAGVQGQRSGSTLIIKLANDQEIRAIVEERDMETAMTLAGGLRG